MNLYMSKVAFCVNYLRTPWTEDPGGLYSMGPKELDTTEHALRHLRILS